MMTYLEGLDRDPTDKSIRNAITQVRRHVAGKCRFSLTASDALRHYRLIPNDALRHYRLIPDDALRHYRLIPDDALRHYRLIPDDALRHYRLIPDDALRHFSVGILGFTVMGRFPA